MDFDIPVRRFTLPNGDTIISLREDVLRSAIEAANKELRNIRTLHTRIRDLHSVLELNPNPSGGTVP